MVEKVNFWYYWKISGFYSRRKKLGQVVEVILSELCFVWFL